MRFIDLTGQKFHRLTAIGWHRHNKGIYWRCRCDCGKIVRSVLGTSLRNGNTKSCGCWHRDAMVRFNHRHGMSGTPEYRAYNNMKRRCYDKTQPYYEHYGKRGIQVCKKWLNSFSDFLKDVGPIPGPRYTLERKNVDGHYTKRNVKWATQAEQTRNKRNSRRLTYQGKTQTLSEWSRELGIGRKTISFRLDKGMSIKRAFSKRDFRKDNL